MKYLVLLIGDGELKPWSEHDDEEQAAVMRQFEAFHAAVEERDGVEILAGEALAGPAHATTVRTRGGSTVLTEGPYTEAIEQMGGFYLVETPDLDALLELLRVLPPYDMQLSPAVDPY
ncbi:hypothetical protein F4692_003938 [Nocardioides cavernae]|uniref:YCII-related domain-containing protein n=1 Tax=Nocardioides cavernae TaxID=1921566 RepID=A0A7Y9KUL1_9ACTN|nr:YciI family protein [Nocardioides cavernae]NYE38787.1 hypothetical protein [Nocardioides cavernae]